MYLDRLVPNHVVLRLRPEAGTLLRQATRDAGNAVEDENLSEECRANLLASAESGIYGVQELSALSAFLAKEGKYSVKELVVEAEWEGLSEKEHALKTSALLASQKDNERRREALRAAADREEYSRLLGIKKVVGGEGLREFAPQAALGGGLLIALVSATLLGYFLGLNLLGPSGAWTVALIFGIGTLILEATLLLLRLSRHDVMEARAREQRKPAKPALGGSALEKVEEEDKKKR